MNWKKVALLATGALISLSAARAAYAITYDLEAAPTVKTMPDGVTVPMWGFALTGSTPSVPGPALVVPPGDTTLTVNLTNHLGSPVSLVIPVQTASTESGVAFSLAQPNP